jgi:hypothetical protein
MLNTLLQTTFKITVELSDGKGSLGAAKRPWDYELIIRIYSYHKHVKDEDVCWIKQA